MHCMQKKGNVRNMKKTKLFVLGISSLLVLAGCGEVTPSSSSEATSETSSSSQTNTSSSQDSVSSASESSSSDISSSEAVKTYDIYVTCDAGATVTEIASKAEEGEEVHFTLTVLEGFELSSIKATSGTNEISLTVGFDGDYSFTMPRKGVQLTVVTARKLYEVSKNDVAGFIKSITQKKVGSDSYVALETITTTDTDDEGEEIVSSSYDAAEYGATVLVTLNESVSSYSITGVSVNDKAVELKDGETSFSFVMGHEKTSIKVSYDYTTIPVVVENSEHITLSLFSDDKVTAVTNSYTPYKDLYIKAISSSEDYGVRTLKYSYTDGNGSTKTEDVTSSLEEGFYHFRMPLYDGGIKLIVTEYNMHAYKGYAFVGEFAQVNFSYASQMADYKAFSSESTMAISESGDVNYARSSITKYDNYSIGSLNGDKDAGVISLAKSGSYTISTIDYHGDVLVYDAYFRASAKESTDIAIAYKKADSSATYTTKSTQFKLGNVSYALATFFKDETLVESVLVERGSTNKIHYGVEVSILEGEFVSDAKAIFTVKEGENTLLKVGYKDKGGAANRTALSDEYGTYETSDGKSLYLNGAGVATYDGTTYSYSLADDGVTITLSSDSKTIVGTLDLTAKTFTVTSEEEITGYAWSGKTYQGKSQYNAYDDEVQATWTVFFHSDEDQIDASSTFNAPYYDTNGKNIEYTVTDRTTVTTKFCTAAYPNGYAVTMKYNASKDTFTVNGGVNADYFKDAVFTLVA